MQQKNKYTHWEIGNWIIIINIYKQTAPLTAGLYCTTGTEQMWLDQQPHIYNAAYCSNDNFSVNIYRRGRPICPLYIIGTILNPPFDSDSNVKPGMRNTVDALTEFRFQLSRIILGGIVRGSHMNASDSSLQHLNDTKIVNLKTSSWLTFKDERLVILVSQRTPLVIFSALPYSRSNRQNRYVLHSFWVLHIEHRFWQSTKYLTYAWILHFIYKVWNILLSWRNQNVFWFRSLRRWRTLLQVFGNSNSEQSKS